MQTVSLFPHLLDYQMLGVFMIRATVGLIFIYFVYTKIIHEHTVRAEFFEKLKLRPTKVFFWIAVTAEHLIGAGLLLGLYTQAAALLGGFLMALTALIKRHHPTALPHNSIEFYLLLAITTLSLLFLGPGAFAFDLPL